MLGYERDAEGNGRFLLGHWDEKWSYASEVSIHKVDSPRSHRDTGKNAKC